MRIVTTAWRALGLMTLVTLATTGCSRWLDIVPPTAVSETRPEASIAQDERVPLVLDAVKISRNGSPQNPSTDTERRFLGALQTLGLFSQVSQFDASPAASREKFVAARLSIDDTIDPHAGAAAWKGMVIGASMFLLSPVIGLEYDYGTQVTLELERWDGNLKTYRAQASGTAHYELFGATPVMIDELKGHVLEACITNLLDQVAQDTSLYVSSSAPPADRRIRTITVKARRATPGILPVAAHPVSASSGQ